MLKILRDPITLEIARQILDVLLVWVLVYQFFRLIRGTQGWRMLGGILVYSVALFVSKVLDLRTLYWILEKFTLLGPVALVILFLPQLRAAIEKLNLLPEFSQVKTNVTTIEEIIASVFEMARHRTGALIAIDPLRSLDDVIVTGVQLDATVSQPLLASIFYDQNPLHDGAVIIRGDKIAAAACQLPLSVNNKLDRHMHMRHRAAAGVTESFDCICIVASEERGIVSISYGGHLHRADNPQEMREMLQKLLKDDSKNGKRRFGQGRDRKAKDSEAAVLQ